MESESGVIRERDGLSKYCNENNFEIKGIIPIDRAQSSEYGQTAVNTWGLEGSSWGWGLGKGWGITMTDGFAAMLQSIEMLSDEEYEQRIAEDKRLETLKEEKSRLEDEKKKLSSLIDQAEQDHILGNC